MKTKTITLYEYNELSPKAKEKARAKWNETNDDPFMQSHMINLLKEKLEERGIKYDTDSMDVRYSLSHSQGDGFMFEGIIHHGAYIATVKHSGHYYHKYSKNVEIVHAETNADAPQSIYDSFEKVYIEICDEMERIGYDHIEHITSEESFSEACEANEWTFREDGTREDE